MQPSTIVLLHSPLTGAAAWGRLPEVLRAEGLNVVVPEVTGDDQAPYAGRYVAHAALQIAANTAQHLAAAEAASGTTSTVLVGHSGAGPLLPQLGFARRSAHDPVRGYVFLDAGLPRPGAPASRLDLLAVEDATFASDLRAVLEADGRFPDWTSSDLVAEVPDPADRALLMASLRPRPIDFFVEPLPAPIDWPDAPCGYLQTSSAYDVPARLARGRGWPTTELATGHFAALRDPSATAAALLGLVERL